jgi:hypothetical protein
VTSKTPDFGYSESALPHSYRVKRSEMFVVCGISYKAPAGGDEDGKIILGKEVVKIQIEPHWIKTDATVTTELVCYMISDDL